MCTIIKINSPNKCIFSSKKNYLNDFDAIFRYYNRTGADEDNLVIVCDQCMLSLLVGPRLHHTWTYFDLWTLWRCLVKAELVPALSVSLLWQNLQIAECFKIFAFTSWNSTWSLKPNFYYCWLCRHCDMSWIGACTTGRDCALRSCGFVPLLLVCLWCTSTSTLCCTQVQICLCSRTWCWAPDYFVYIWARSRSRVVRDSIHEISMRIMGCQLDIALAIL